MSLQKQEKYRANQNQVQVWFDGILLNSLIWVTYTQIWFQFKWVIFFLQIRFSVPILLFYTNLLNVWLYKTCLTGPCRQILMQRTRTIPYFLHIFLFLLKTAFNFQ